MDPAEYKTVQIGVSKFWAAKYGREAAKNWDKFYKRNKTNFFKARHWTTSEETDGFPCLTERAVDGNGNERPIIVIEAGCGVANCAFPLLDVNPQLFIYAFDFAASAIALVKEADQYDSERCHAFVWDFCRQDFDDVPDHGALGVAQADYCMLVFVLSAVPPELQCQGLRNLHKLLKPGARLLFRDYATNDMAQKRFATKSQIEENWYVRQDSTLSYFFDEDTLQQLMSNAGFDRVYCRRVHRVIKNRKEGVEMHRTFLQAEYIVAQR